MGERNLGSECVYTVGVKNVYKIGCLFAQNCRTAKGKELNGVCPFIVHYSQLQTLRLPRAVILLPPAFQIWAKAVIQTTKV